MSIDPPFWGIKQLSIQSTFNRGVCVCVFNAFALPESHWLNRMAPLTAAQHRALILHSEKGRVNTNAEIRIQSLKYLNRLRHLRVAQCVGAFFARRQSERLAPLLLALQALLRLWWASLLRWH